MKKIIVRQIRLSELPQLLPLFREAVYAIPDYSPRLRSVFLRKYSLPNMRRKLARKQATCLVALINGEIAGFCWGGLIKPSLDGVYWMNWIGVARKFRRQGVATALIQNLEKLLQRKSYHKLWFNIDPDNRTSAKTFRALGYRQLARVRHHWYGLDALLWEKYLAFEKH